MQNQRVRRQGDKNVTKGTTLLPCHKQLVGLRHAKVPIFHLFSSCYSFSSGDDWHPWWGSLSRNAISAYREACVSMTQKRKERESTINCLQWIETKEMDWESYSEFFNEVWDLQNSCNGCEPDTRLCSSSAFLKMHGKHSWFSMQCQDDCLGMWYGATVNLGIPKNQTAGA